MCRMGCVLLCFVLLNPLSVCSKKSPERLVIFRLKENILPSSRLVDSVNCVEVCECMGLFVFMDFSVFMSTGSKRSKSLQLSMHFIGPQHILLVSGSEIQLYSKISTIYECL